MTRYAQNARWANGTSAERVRCERVISRGNSEGVRVRVGIVDGGWTWAREQRQRVSAGHEG